MKTRLTLLALLISIMSIAQNGINYKALIKDANGNVISNQFIDLILSIQLQGTTVFSETHIIETDLNGIAIATIGEGSNITGVFETITWNVGNAELNVQIDFGDGLVDFGNSPFNAVPYAIETLNKEGLIRANGGWRLEGVIVDGEEGYGSVGNNATDLSVSNANGASVTYPYGASGAGSFATGRNTVALENYSTALGYGTTATEIYATAMGNDTHASGRFSTAMGRGTYATSIYSTVIGRYNLGYGNPTVWNDDDPLFQIGNGSSGSLPSNAFTVFKNGRQLISSDGDGIDLYSENTGINIINPGDRGIVITDASDDGIAITNAQDDGIIISANDRGAIIVGGSVGVYTRAFSNANPDIILGGNGNGNTEDDGIISSDPNYAGSDIYLRSNDAVVIELDNDDNGAGNFFIQDSDGDNVFSVSEAGNVNIEGYVTGLEVRSSISSNPDITLRGNGSGNSQDDGIISSDPNYAGSDIYLRSNDALVVELDNDDNGSGSLIIRNGDDDDVFTVNESGNVSFDGGLQLGSGVIESPMPDVRINSDDDVFIILDTDDNELGLFGIFNQNLSDPVFQVYDSGNALLVGNLTQTSDRRLKRDIEDLSYGLKEILQLNPKQYYWKNKEQNKKSLGLIAQEVKPIIENIVNTQDNEEKTLGISYTELIPVLINAIKEQNKIIESQGEALKASNTNYEALLSRIEIIESNSSN